MPDGLEPHDLHMALAGDGLALIGPVSLHLGAGGFDAQIFGGQLEAFAIVEYDGEEVLGRAQSQLGRPRHRLLAHAISLSESWRASSASMIGMPSRMG